MLSAQLCFKNFGKAQCFQFPSKTLVPKYYLNLEAANKRNF